MLDKPQEIFEERREFHTIALLSRKEIERRIYSAQT
jgi:hypothetical protein